MNYVTTPQRVGFQQGLKEGREQGLKQGLQEGEAALLIRLLQRRFFPLPSNYLLRIQQADIDTLFVWGERMLEANTLEEVFN